MSTKPFALVLAATLFGQERIDTRQARAGFRPAASFEENWRAARGHLERRRVVSPELRQAEALATALEQTRAALWESLAGTASEPLKTLLESEIQKLDALDYRRLDRDLAAHARPRAARLREALRTAAANPDPVNLEAAMALLPLPSAQEPRRRIAAFPREVARLDANALLNQMQPLAAGEPTPADLAENPIVQLTPEIRAKAAELGNSPLRLYQYVRNNYRYEPYQLANLTSGSVHFGGQGNDVDLATYLVALLRAARIPARYGAANISVPFAGVNAWLGTTSNEASSAILEFLGAPKQAGATTTFLHFYVEAFVGGAWVRLDPSFKPLRLQPSVRFTRPLFNRLAYLGSNDPRVAIDAYLDQVRAAISAAQPGASLEDALLTRRDESIVPDLSNQLPASLPYTVLGSGSVSDLSDGNTFTNRIVIQISDSGDAKAVLVRPVSIPVYRVMAGTLAFSFDSQNQVRLTLDGSVLGSATQAVTGRPLDISINAYSSDLPDRLNQYTHSISIGQTAVVVLNAGQSSDWLLGTRTDRLLSRVQSAPVDLPAATTELLALAGLRYFNRVNEFNTRLGGPLHVRYLPGVPEEAMVLSFGPAKSVFDRPLALAPDRVLIDAAGVNGRFLGLDSANVSGADWTSIRQAQGLTTSSLEHQLWEELVLLPAASTTKLLQLARPSGAQIFTLTRANAASVLPQLSIPSWLADIIRTDTNQGLTIVTTDRPIAAGNYRGFGWIRENSDATQGAYAIQRINGGDTGGNLTANNPPPAVSGTTGNPSATNGTAVSDPVNVANGNLIFTARDLAISSRGPGVVLTRTYNSLSATANGPFGFGWTHNYLLSIRESGTSLLFTSGTGGSYTFTATGAAYVCAVLPSLRLTKDAEGYLMRSVGGGRIRFNARGQLLSVADRLGNAVQFSYGAAGNLIRVTDSLNRDLTLTYNAQNRIAEARDFSGRVTRYEYSAAGDLTTVTNAAGGRATYSYFTDSTFLHLLKSVATPEGRTATYQYYANRKAARVVEPGGRTARFFYLPYENRTDVVDGRGYLSTYFYNALGNVTRHIQADGNILDTEYSAAALPTAFVDASGRRRVRTYDAVGNLTSATDFLGQRAAYVYDPESNDLVSMTDPRGSPYSFEYDSRGNLTRQTAPEGITATFTHNDFGQLLTAANAEGVSVQLTYDEAGNLIQSQLPGVTSAKIAYDRLRRPVSAEDLQGNTWTVSYDVLNRATAAASPLGAAVSATYSSDGLLTKAIAPDGRATSYSYDALGTLNRVTQPDGTAAESDLSHNECRCTAAELVTMHKDAANIVTTFDYDSQDRLTASRDAMNRETRYVYDGDGRLTALTRANQRKTAFQYDANGRLTRKVFPDGSDARYTYDENGNMLSAVNANVQYSFVYDRANRLVSFIDSRVGSPVTYAYDRASRIVSLTDPQGGVQSFTWDNSGRLASIASPSGASAIYAYNAIGQVASLTYSNGVATAYSYDASYRLTEIASLVAPFRYTYDINGRRTGTGDTVAEYDSLNRLVSAAPAPGAASPAARARRRAETNPARYSYDGAGNRLSSTAGPYSYDNAGRLIAAEGFQYTYDDSGNLIRKTGVQGSTDYTWDSENQLVSIRFAGGATASYQYDPLGRRIEATAQGQTVRYFYSGASILFETDASGAVQVRYTHGLGIDQPLIMERAGVAYFYHIDVMGSVAAITDAAGSAVCSYAYDPFGAHADCGAIPNRIRFAGREFDAESGLYYLRARYYDPAVGRFIGADPLDLAGMILGAQDGGENGGRGSPQHLNAYSYAANNPLGVRDPMGLKPSRRELAFRNNEDYYLSAEELLAERRMERYWSKDGVLVQVFKDDGSLSDGIVLEGSGAVLGVMRNGELLAVILREREVTLSRGVIPSLGWRHAAYQVDDESSIFQDVTFAAALAVATPFYLMDMGIEEARTWEYFRPSWTDGAGHYRPFRDLSEGLFNAINPLPPPMIHLPERPAWNRKR